MKRKNILIITHRPQSNYGGIAQAYALQRFLRTLGHNVETTTTLGPPYVRYILSNPILKKYISSNPVVRKILRKGPRPDIEAISKLTGTFVKKNIVEIPLRIAEKKSKQGLYDLYIAGSDQIWRPRYSYLPDYMFSFVKDGSAPKISYAASFGKDDLDEFSAKLKRKTRRLAQRFDAISVREKSGVDLVRHYWNRDAHHHIDPTLLLSAEDYDSLIQNASLPFEAAIETGIFTYILDPSEHAQSIVSLTEKVLEKSSYSLIDGDLNGGNILPSFEQWLLCFKESSFVITDSFHGTVFSIIFNKPFISIGNRSRGLARFSSLLGAFSLEDRLILDSDEVSPDLIKKAIDWEKINRILDREKKKSKNYLCKFL